MFITFEGLDGAGKSTQIARLTSRLERTGWKVLNTREPGGTPIGDDLRAMLLDIGQTRLSARTEALLYAASRAQLLEEVIRPALANGELVICDRYVDASIAYQGAGLGLGVDAVRELNRFATNDLTPDVTIMLDVPVETSRGRVFDSRRGQAPDRIEKRDHGYFERVRNAFLQLSKDEHERICVLDANRTEEELEQEIWTIVSNRLGNSFSEGGAS